MCSRQKATTRPERYSTYAFANDCGNCCRYVEQAYEFGFVFGRNVLAVDGDFTVTNKNLFFVTPETTTKISVKKVVSVNRLTNGLERECARARGKRYTIANLDIWSKNA